MRGRYGPYVTDGSTNANIRDGIDPLTVTLEQALGLIAERAAKGAPKKKSQRQRRLQAHLRALLQLFSQGRHISLR